MLRYERHYVHAFLGIFFYSDTVLMITYNIKLVVFIDFFKFN